MVCNMSSQLFKYGCGYGIQRHFQQYFSYIVVVSFIGGGNRSTRRKPPTCHKSLTNFIWECCIGYISPWTWFELTTLVAIGTDFICSCKSNYHTITTTSSCLNSITTRQIESSSDVVYTRHDTNNCTNTFMHTIHLSNIFIWQKMVMLLDFIIIFIKKKNMSQLVLCHITT